MIEKLTKHLHDGFVFRGAACATETFPDTEEMMEKINEIIDYLNKKENER